MTLKCRIIVFAVFGFNAAVFAKGRGEVVPPPLWKTNIAEAYPRSDYIVQSGGGKSKAAAETAAVSAISRYFSSEVSTETHIYSSSSIINGKTRDLSEASDEAFVKSQTKLIAVRYTKPWYNAAEHQWEVCAYIERTEAWSIYEPVVRRAADVFRELYKKAEDERDVFRKIPQYNAAQKAADDAVDTIIFARILNPDAAERGFGDVLKNAAAIPQKINSAKERASIFIECSSDVGGVVYSAANKAISGAGWTVSANKKSAGAVCSINIAENKEALPAGTFYTPAANIVLNGTSGALFSTGVKAERVGARNPDVARQRSYEALAEKIEKDFKLNIE